MDQENTNELIQTVDAAFSLLDLEGKNIKSVNAAFLC